MSDRRIGGYLLVGVLCVYLGVLHGQVDIYDTQCMLAVTENLVNHGSLHTIGAGFVDPFHQCTPYSPYGIAMSVLAVPSYALSKAVGKTDVLVNLINPIITALTVLVLYRFVRALRWSQLHAVLVATAYGLFSMALWYSTEGFSEPGVALCVTAIAFGIVRWGQGLRLAPLWIGLAAGAAIQFRSDSLLTVWIGLLAIPLFVPWSQVCSWRTGMYLGSPMAVSLFALVFYNELRYHQLWVDSYGQGQGLHNPLLLGLHGLLYSGGKSLFLYNPLAILGVVGLVILLFRAPRVAILFLLLIVPRVLFFSKWSVWDGGWCWGPRFLLPTLPFFMVAAVEVLRVTNRQNLSGFLVRVCAVLLTMLSAFVNFLSVRVPINQWLGVLYTPADHARFGLHGFTTLAAQLQGEDFHFPTGSIWGDLTLLHHGAAVMAPYFWLTGRSYLGLFLLAVGALGVAAALLGASTGLRREG